MDMEKEWELVSIPPTVPHTHLLYKLQRHEYITCPNAGGRTSLHGSLHHIYETLASLGNHTTSSRILPGNSSKTSMHSNAERQETVDETLWAGLSQTELSQSQWSPTELLGQSAPGWRHFLPLQHIVGTFLIDFPTYCWSITVGSTTGISLPSLKDWISFPFLIFNTYLPPPEIFRFLLGAHRRMKGKLQKAIFTSQFWECVDKTLLGKRHHLLM